MNKEWFVQELRRLLVGLPQEEINRVIEYYEELFDGALEEGKTDAQIIDSLETPQQIANRIKAEYNANYKISYAQQKPSFKNWAKALIAVFAVLSFPISFPLFIVFIAVFSAFTFAFIGILGVVCVGIVKIFFGSFPYLFSGIVLLFSDFLSGLGKIGCGLMGLGMSTLLLYLMLKLVLFIFAKLVCKLKSFVDKILEKRLMRI